MGYVLSHLTKSLMASSTDVLVSHSAEGNCPVQGNGPVPAHLLFENPTPLTAEGNCSLHGNCPVPAHLLFEIPPLKAEGNCSVQNCPVPAQHAVSLHLCVYLYIAFATEGNCLFQRNRPVPAAAPAQVVDHIQIAREAFQAFKTSYPS